jgi:hypothetical protein
VLPPAAAIGKVVGELGGKEDITRRSSLSASRYVPSVQWLAGPATCVDRAVWHSVYQTRGDAEMEIHSILCYQLPRRCRHGACVSRERVRDDLLQGTPQSGEAAGVKDEGRGWRGDHG